MANTTSAPAPTTSTAHQKRDQRGVWGWLFASALILVVRKTDAFTNPQFWAEDALPFYKDALYIGPDAFTRAYAGYHHFLPRFIAWCASYLHPCHAPAFYVISSLAITLGIIALLFSRRLNLTGKPLLALAVVLVPHSGEIFLTPTNLQWLGGLALFITALKADPDRMAGWILDAGVVLAFGFSGFFIVLTIPFFVARALYRRSAASALLLAIALVPASMQVFEYWRTATPAEPGTPVHWPAFFTFLSLHIPLELFGSKAWAATVPRWAAITGGIFTLALFGWLARSRSREHAVSRYAMLAFAILLILAATRRVRFDGPPADDFINVDRYVVLPKILLLWILGSAASASTLRGRIAAVLYATSVIVTLPWLRFPPLIDLEWHRYCDALEAGKEVTVPINPDWSVTFPAREPK